MLSNQIVLPKRSDCNCFESFLGEMQLVTRFNKVKKQLNVMMSPCSFVLLYNVRNSKKMITLYLNELNKAPKHKLEFNYAIKNEFNLQAIITR